jgi:hypothetical protein
MKHFAPDEFDVHPPHRVAPMKASTWRERLAAWWWKLGWDQTSLPQTLEADIHGDHPNARPVRGRADWERQL